MIVMCRKNRGHSLASNYRGLFFTEHTVFDLTPDVSYSVYEMALFNFGLIVLIVDDTRQPNWYPIELFEVEEGSLPDDWVFAFRGDIPGGMQAVWGPAILVNDLMLEESLAGQDSNARLVFWRDIAIPRESGSE